LHHRYSPDLSGLLEGSEFVGEGEVNGDDHIFKTFMLEFRRQSIADLVKFFVHEQVTDMLGRALFLL
jgi:hypothetical protein